jgi:hypothetical protein
LPQSDTVIRDLSAWPIHTQHVVVDHIVLVPSIVELDVGLAIMARVNVDFAIEGMSRWVGGVDMGDEGSWHGGGGFCGMKVESRYVKSTYCSKSILYFPLHFIPSAVSTIQWPRVASSRRQHSVNAATVLPGTVIGQPTSIGV